MQQSKGSGEAEEGTRERSVAQECVLSLMKTISEEVKGGERGGISRFLEELEEVLGVMKNKNGIEYSVNGCWREIEELTTYDSGL